MGKVIKLKESDIRKIVLKLVSEQQSMADETNPLDMIKPSPKVIPAPQSQRQEPTGGEQKFRPMVNEKILAKKIAIRTGLKRLQADLEELIVHSGINPDTNNIARDINKVSEKFESLFGDPVAKEEGETE